MIPGKKIKCFPSLVKLHRSVLCSGIKLLSYATMSATFVIILIFTRNHQLSNMRFSASFSDLVFSIFEEDTRELKLER